MPPKPPNSFYLFHSLRGWMDLHFINHSLWDSMHLTQPEDSPELQRCLGLSFLWSRRPSLPLQMFQQSLQCPAVEPGLHVDMMSSAYWVHFIDVGKENKDLFPANIHCIPYCGTVRVVLGKHVKGTLWLLPHAGKLFLVIGNLYLPESCWNLLEDKHFCRNFCKKPQSKTISVYK